MNHELCLTNARIVTPETVFDGHVHVQDGMITDVSTGACPCLQKKNGCSMHDLGGEYLLPGLVELHTDNLEKHLMPRPSVVWPSAAAAFLAHDAQLVAAGITTVFDSLCVGETQDKGRYTMLALAFDAFTQCKGGEDVRVDHRLHIRCELNDATMWDMFEPLSHTPSLQLVSLMDHTPGQRQWRSTQAYRTYYSNHKSWSEQEFARNMAELQEQQATYVPLNTRRVVQLCHERAIPMASHDDTTTEHVDEALQNGMSISEFPTTLEAAAHAAKSGMTVLMGSPNVVRGKSHSGNVSAIQVAQNGHLHGLSSDYVPASLLHGAFVLHHNAGIALHEAINFVSLLPAKAVGLADKGSIQTGMKADMVRVAMRQTLPVVREVWNQGRKVF